MCQTGLVSKSVQWAVAWTQTLWPQASVLDPLLFDFQTGGYEGESEMMSNRASQFVFHHRLHKQSIAARDCAWERYITSCTFPQHSMELHREMKLWKPKWTRSWNTQQPSMVHRSRWPCTTSRKSELKRRADLGATGTLWKRTVSKRANSIYPM